jgi:hypothetical protein
LCSYRRGLHAPVIGELSTLNDILDCVHIEGGFMPPIVGELSTLNDILDCVHIEGGFMPQYSEG